MTEAPPAAEPVVAEDLATVPVEVVAGPTTRGRFDRLTPTERRRLAGAILFVVVVVAVTVRVVGTRFGFPLLVHPDEWAVVDAVVDMARRNSFEPPWSYRPDHVEMKIDYLLFAAYSGLVRHTSVETAFAHDPVPFYWIARLATVAFGVGSVVIAYLIGRLTSLRLALVMAALFAIFPAYVWHAHYATPDVPLTFALLALTYALMRYVRHPSWPSLLWASFAVALGTAIKYPAAVGAVMIAIVVVAVAVRDRSWWRSVVHGVGALGAMIGFLFVITPTLFTNFQGVLDELAVQSAGDRLGHPDLGFGGNLVYYAASYIGYAGIVLTLLGVVGLVLVVRQRQLERLPWFIGVLVWVALSKLPLTWERWGLPMWITPLLLAAVGVVCLFERFRSARTSWIPYVACAWIGLHLVTSVAMVDTTLVSGDTRSVALAYVDAHGITPENSIYEGYSPFQPGAALLFFKQVKKVDGGYTFATTKGEPAEYAVLSSGMYDRVFKDASAGDKQAVYEWIRQHGELVTIFVRNEYVDRTSVEPFDFAGNVAFIRNAVTGSLTGPTIEIYRLPQATS